MDRTDPGTVTRGTRGDMEVLVACVRAVVGSPRPAVAGLDGDGRIRPVERNRDWSGLVRTALEHGVMPHLFTGIGEVAPDVPASVLNELRNQYRANGRRNLSAAGELLQLLALFEEHGIQAVPLKGPVLAVSAYRTLAMRQFTDIDVLVPPHQAASAERLLASRGYQVRSADQTSVVAVRSDGDQRVAVDLQWALADRRYSFPLSERRMRGRLERVAFLNGTVWQPSAPDQLLLLCAHPAKHCWSRLGWIGDIAAFIRSHRDRIDWERVLSEARQSGGERLLLLGLRVTSELLAMTVPPEFVRRTQAEAVVVPLAAELCEGLLHGASLPLRLNGSYGVVEAGLLYVRSRERLRDKLPYLAYLGRLLGRWLRIAPNEQDRAVVALPRYLAFLYPLIRPFRLARKYGSRALACGLGLRTCWR